ncbi:hypothetical protein QWY85_16220 [Neolewinella lacunae]|uniref:Uncharacterized protein n=1 Tax=Neolewinella lacunae TaxID=1517758 RepID=A0A923PHR4_9BACT|nr:hypothetical protein [Neolewinella lacunae]MBC6993509.1 hypothetical protein [Neolewinella lacunae]MDN3636215.1 hypothetical protein [Neolewinella lacunae]
MQVPKIQAAVATFRDWLPTEAAARFLPYWETQQNWQQHFNVEAKDLAAAYDLALDSKTNRRHYRRNGYDPKQSMLLLMRWETEFVREAFRDLFSEDRSVEGRVSRFVFYINELFNRYRDQHPKDRTPSHYHQDDYEMASLYLSGQYPLIYAPYSTATLQTVCSKLGAREVPLAADFPRYTKLLVTLRSFLAKDEVVMERYQAALRPSDYQGESALLVWWFFKMLEEERF